jgi:UDP-GlcNAc3NAcA epimerase
MKNKTIFTVVGARPQFIKAAPVCRQIRKHFTEILVHTGQHFDASMSDIFFDELGIPQPDYNLGIHGSSHGAMTAQMLESIENLLLEIKPDMVLLYGDTNSTMAAALAASKLHFPIAHIEAGPRTFDRKQPEEVNRVFTDYVSVLKFCPTKQSLKNLQAEQMGEGAYHVGDVMYDAALYARDKASQHSRILDQLKLGAKKYSVATIHRQEHTGAKEDLSKIIAYLNARSCPVILPLHPRTKKAIEHHQIDLGDIKVIDPLGYLDMTWLIANAQEVITDSGGVPKEAYFHGVPCTTIGNYTPWPETVAKGWNRLWSSDTWLEPRMNIDDYGDGNAAKKIAWHIEEYFER